MTITTHQWTDYLKKLGFSEMEINELFQSSLSAD